MGSQDSGLLPTEGDLLKTLYQHNPWWHERPIPDIKLKPFKRRDFYKLLKNLDDNKVLAVIGARQVGKTTMLYQLIERLLSQNASNKVLFLSLDDPHLFISPVNLARVFDLYSSYIVKRPLSELDGIVYFIFDEIQSLKNWQDVLKRWVDLGYKIKFIISGSSSADIMGGSSESLVGRLNMQIVLPLKFLEYVRFKEQSEADSLLSDANIQMRDGLKLAVRSQNPAPFYDSVAKVASALAPIKDRILAYLNEYLVQGGYPEIATLENRYEKAEIISRYLELTIYKDIVKTGQIRDPASLESFFAIIAKESSNIVSRQQISRSLGINRNTLNTYLWLLKEAFLVSDAELYAKSAVKRGRSEKKLYVNDVGIRNVTAGIFDEHVLSEAAEVGKMVETVVADHTRRLKFNLEPVSRPHLFYWRSSNEVDLVIDLFQKPLPIEVKFRQSIDESDLRGLRDFSEKFKCKMSVVVTKGSLEVRGPSVLVPAWLYLLMC